MTIETDTSINAAGDIRWTGAGTHLADYSVLEFIQYMQKLQDDGQAAGGRHNGYLLRIRV